MSKRLRGREIDDDEGRQLVRIIPRGSGLVVTSRRSQIVLLPAQGMNMFQPEVWLSLAGLFLGIALRIGTDGTARSGNRCRGCGEVRND